MKTAIITGATGQDGSYLSELLLEKEYTVVGLRRRSSSEKGLERIEHLLINKNFKLVEADITDAEFLDVTPKQTHQEVSKSKEYDRVLKHINHKDTISFDILSKCKGAITESDHDLKELYVLKVIELSTKKEELESIKEWVDPEIDFDIFTSYSDRLNEFKKK